VNSIDYVDSMSGWRLGSHNKTLAATGVDGGFRWLFAVLFMRGEVEC